MKSKIQFLILVLFLAGCYSETDKEICGEWKRSVSAGGVILSEQLSVLADLNYVWDYLSDGKPDTVSSHSGVYEIDEENYVITFIPSDTSVEPVVRGFIKELGGSSLKLIDTAASPAVSRQYYLVE